MKFLTFEQGMGEQGLGEQGSSGARLGALAADGGIVDLATRDQGGAFRSMRALIEAGEEALARAAAILSEAGETIDPATVTWLAPLPRPLQIRDFVAFEQHMLTAGWHGAKVREKLGGPPAPAEPLPIMPIWYEQPIYYKGNRFAVAGTGATVHWPQGSRIIDYELELACIIGKPGRDIAAKDAAGHIFGYTIFNDLTARDLQFREMQGPFGPAKGKDFDGANVLGPVIVTADEIDPSALAMRARVNGALWSEGSSATMHWSFADMIAHVSTSETLHRGEILGSGTMGRGCGLELGRFLKHGDVVVLEIEGIGSLETIVDAPHVPEGLTL